MGAVRGLKVRSDGSGTSGLQTAERAHQIKAAPPEVVDGWARLPAIKITSGHFAMIVWTSWSEALRGGGIQTQANSVSRMCAEIRGSMIILL